MNSNAFDSDEPDLVLAEIIERLTDMHNRLGHELLAVQAVCGYLLARQCVGQTDPASAVQAAVSMLSGTGVALADLRRRDGRYANFDTRGATDALERIGSVAEQSIADWLGQRTAS